MKAIYLFYLSLFAISCADNYEHIQQEHVNNQPKTKSIVDSTHVSVTNPDLLYNWENLERVVLNTSSPGNLNTISLPWIPGSPTNLPANMLEPLKKDDGWRMLFHTFKDYGLDKYQNYFIMYNNITGAFRVYYFNEIFSDKNNNFMWVMRSMNNTPSHLLEHLSYPIKDLTTPATAKEVYISNFSAHDFSSLGYGWNGFEINTSYQKGFINKKFSIAAINKNISDISLEGTTSGSIDGKIFTTNSSENKLVSGVTNLSGDAAKKFIDSKVKDSSISSKRIKDAISGISTTGYTTAIKRGLNLIFGSILGTNKRVTEQDVKLSINTNINIKGTESFPSVASVAPISNINLSEIFGSEHIGIWTLAKRPKVILDRYSTAELYQDNYPIGGEIRNGRIHIQAFWLFVDQLEVIVNPDIKQYLTKQSISHEIIASLSSHNSGYGYHFDLTGFPGFEVTNVIEPIYNDSKTGFTIISYDIVNNNVPEIIIEQDLPYSVGSELIYDWAGTREDGLAVVVTVDQTFNINGKEHNIVSSKHFMVNFSVEELSDNFYYDLVLPYIVNKGKFYEKK